MTSTAFPYSRSTTPVDKVVYGHSYVADATRQQHFSMISRETDAKIFKSQYLHLEKQLIESFNYVAPCQKNASAYSINFAQIIKQSANLFELISKHVYLQLYSCNADEVKKLKIKNFLSLDREAGYSNLEVGAFQQYDNFTNQEVYKPFMSLLGWDKASPIQDAEIPQWWTANNKLKHSNAGLENYGTLEKSFSSVAAVFVALHCIYGHGFLFGLDTDPQGFINLESPKTNIFFVK